MSDEATSDPTEDRSYPTENSTIVSRLITAPALITVTGGVILLLATGIVLGGLTVGGIMLWLSSDDAPKPSIPPPVFSSAGPTVEKIQDLGEVVSNRVVVTDILVGRGQGYEAMWRIRGDALLSCDLRQAKIISKDIHAKAATIQLPPIRVLSARVDHSATKMWDIKRQSWLPFTTGSQSEFFEAAMYHAQRMVANTAGSTENRAVAADRVELLMQKHFALVDWDVNVEWAENNRISNDTVEKVKGP